MKKQSLLQLDLPYLPPRVAPRHDTRVLMALYVLGSAVLRDFTKPLGITAYNVGITLERNLGEKVLDMSQRAYASIIAPAEDRDREIFVHPGGADWCLEAVADPAADPKAARVLSELPGGMYCDGAVLFRLPHHIRIADVERQFQRLLEARNLNKFLGSEAAWRLLVKACLPADTRLFTDYWESHGSRRSLASEIFVIHPKRNLFDLLQALVLAIAANQR